jgi:AcrR family transcriptional regulator
MPPRGDRSLETREHLLSAAASVFVERGFYGATVREIVARAGLTNPALYYHFRGKEDLYAELIRSGGERFRQLVEAAIARESDPLLQLHAIARAYLQFANEDRTRLRVLYGELFRPRLPEETPDDGLIEFRDWTRTRIDDLLRRANGVPGLSVDDVAETRRMFMALLSGLLLEAARDPASAKLESSLATAVMRTVFPGSIAAEGAA